MIITGKNIVFRNIVRNIRDKKYQIQPCGVDLTLKCIYQWTTPGTVDFDNTFRKPSEKIEVYFSEDRLKLSHGSYLIEFNEVVKIPTNMMGQLFVRSSLFRSGVLISAGVIDSGYEGAVGALLQVINPLGVMLHTNSRMAQLIMHEMESHVSNPYNGMYQKSNSV